jgi:riboflavin synthase
VFTGIIEEVGTLLSVDPLEGGKAFRIGASSTLEGLALGDSVSINGACHTVTDIHAGGFVVQSVATTLQRTALGTYQAGKRLNLERAMRLGDRLDGHLVQGHVDAVGEVRRVERRGEHVLIDFTLPPLVAETSILHGSIALDGVSLTINALPDPGSAQVSIIPHTWQVTSLSDLRAGDPVNLEGDMIGKYVRQLLSRGSLPRPTPPGEHSDGLPGY